MAKILMKAAANITTQRLFQCPASAVRSQCFCCMAPLSAPSQVSPSRVELGLMTIT